MRNAKLAIDFKLSQWLPLHERRRTGGAVNSQSNQARAPWALRTRIFLRCRFLHHLGDGSWELNTSEPARLIAGGAGPEIDSLHHS